MARLIKSPIQIPFGKSGNPLDYYRVGMQGVVLRDNYEWNDILEFDGFAYGNTGSKFMFKGLESGFIYLMFPVEAEKSVPLMEKGILKGKFTFVKKNHYYGIKMVE